MAQTNTQTMSNHAQSPTANDTVEVHNSSVGVSERSMPTLKCEFSSHFEGHTPLYIDLFCGLGAFHRAFSSVPNQSYQCVYACDIDEGVRRLYAANYGLEPEGDIYDIDIANIPTFDILCAGFPCQPFSIAGNRRGFSDETRGGLFFRILDIIDHHRPSKCILENVRNLATIEGGGVIRRITQELTQRGYHVTHQLIDSSRHGSPQARQRVYIVADLVKPYLFPDITHPAITVADILDPAENCFLEYKIHYDLEMTESKARPGACHQVARLRNKKTGKGGRQGERVYSIHTCGPTICASSGGPGAKTGL